MKYTKTLLVLILVILVLGGVILVKSQPKKGSISTPSSMSQTQSPKISSTTPDNLDGATVLANQSITIVFNQPLENKDEFKIRLDPQIGYRLDLSGDRKTVKIIPDKPLNLGTTYTLFISVDSKFTGGGRLDGDKIFHFKTIEYKGV